MSPRERLKAKGNPHRLVKPRVVRALKRQVDKRLAREKKEADYERLIREASEYYGAEIEIVEGTQIVFDEKVGRWR